jgi:hypothetical protein
MVSGGAARTARGEYVQNHTAAAMTTTEATLANIRPAAFRIVRLSKKIRCR